MLEASALRPPTETFAALPVDLMPAANCAVPFEASMVSARPVWMIAPIPAMAAPAPPMSSPPRTLLNPLMPDFALAPKELLNVLPPALPALSRSPPISFWSLPLKPDMLGKIVRYALPISAIVDTCDPVERVGDDDFGLG